MQFLAQPKRQPGASRRAGGHPRDSTPRAGHCAARRASAETGTTETLPGNHHSGAHCVKQQRGNMACTEGVLRKTATSGLWAQEERLLRSLAGCDVSPVPKAEVVSWWQGLGSRAVPDKQLQVFLHCKIFCRPLPSFFSWYLAFCKLTAVLPPMVD